MKYKFFIESDNSPIQQLRESLTSEIEKEGGARMAFAEKYGGVCYGTDTSVAGIAVAGEDPPTAVAGFRFVGTKHNDNKRYSVFEPDKRTKLGKTIAKEMQSLSRTSFSDRVVRKLGLFRFLIGNEMCAYKSVGAVVRERLVIRVPVNEKENAECPEGMIEVPYSSWIAFTEENADIAELKQ